MVIDGERERESPSRTHESILLYRISTAMNIAGYFGGFLSTLSKTISDSSPPLALNCFAN